jgi:hypothetical protein
MKESLVIRMTLLIIITHAVLPAHAQSVKPAIVVLGVTHSGQLLNEYEQPGVLRAFFNRVHPDALCIELSPERFARNDFYEFTYEQQFVLIPFARKKNVPIFPIDWMPSTDDQLLAFGTSDLEVPLFTRKPRGFWGFLRFEDSSMLKERFYFAEDSAQRSANASWYVAYPSSQINFDFARRLYLYRTFLQCKRIEAVAKSFRNDDTILVVIGSLHKDDIEKNLKAGGYNIVASSAFGEISNAEADSFHEYADDFAIANFNLLGLQANSDFAATNLLLQKSMKRLATIKTHEVELLLTRYELLLGKIDITKAIGNYLSIADKVGKTETFTWTGVKSKMRLDNYFDPFGNMTIWERTHLELARSYQAAGMKDLAAKQKQLLLAEFSDLKKAMFLAYWIEYLGKD